MKRPENEEFPIQNWTLLSLEYTLVFVNAESMVRHAGIKVGSIL